MVDNGVGGSVYAAPGVDWVLCEFSMPYMAHPRMRFSAFVETPWNALEGVTPDDDLPINGVAWSQSPSVEYVASPAIAFPPTDGANAGTVNEDNSIFSLLVNVNHVAFPPDALIRIGLYGYTDPYNLAGGDGSDGPFFGTVVSSDFYGAITRDYRGIGSYTPGGLDGAPKKLFIRSDYTDPVFLARLIDTFPELDGFPYEYLTDGTGFKGWHVSFDYDGPPGGPFTWLIGNPADGTPADDPNAWKIWPVNLGWIGPSGPELLKDRSIQTTETWVGTDFEKIQTMHCTVPQRYDPGHVTYTNMATIPAPVDDELYGAFVWGFDQVKYWVPAWHFKDDRTAPVKIAWVDTGLALWTEQAKHTTSRPQDSYTWETADYPTRPEFAEIGRAVVTNIDDLPDDISASNHFGHVRIGTLTINKSTGQIQFAPAEADPVDGGDDGDGPDGDGTAPGRTANPQLRAWTYSLDGHDYYVLRLGDTLSLVYDDYSEQWMDWSDYASLTWRAHCGTNWTGAQNLADTYGSSIICGDDAFGLLWFLNPNQPYDESAEGTGDPVYFSRVTVGQVTMKGREALPCYAAWLTTDMGNPAYTGAGVTLYTSDDAGETWDMHDFITVTPGEASPELSWYSLGQITAPGRLFKIFDNGAIARIDALEMNDPDDEKAED